MSLHLKVLSENALTLPINLPPPLHFTPARRIALKICHVFTLIYLTRQAAAQVESRAQVLGPAGGNYQRAWRWVAELGFAPGSEDAGQLRSRIDQGDRIPNTPTAFTYFNSIC
jgi:hypothetical protein